MPYPFEQWPRAKLEQHIRSIRLAWITNRPAVARALRREIGRRSLGTGVEHRKVDTPGELQAIRDYQRRF